jgi:hypothetical protein
MNPDLKKRLTARGTWVRGLFMLLFVLVFNIVEVAIFVVVAAQFAAHLLTGKDLSPLQFVGRKLGDYLYQIIAYLTYSSDDKPFPFNDWPEAPVAKRSRQKPGPRPLRGARPTTTRGETP